MKYDPKAHHRRSLRLKGYDYSREGWYYVTICTHERKCILGHHVDGSIQLRPYGRIVYDCWKGLAVRYDYVCLDRFVVMPNHLHGIIMIREGGSRTAPTTPVKHKTLGRLVGAFKTMSTKQVNIERDAPGMKLWQRNYFEHIIRNDYDLGRIREYIENNARHWLRDAENPDCADI